MTDLTGKQSTTTGSYDHVIWISFWGNLGLAILKLGMGILGYSRLLFADGLHSSANAVIFIASLIGVIAGDRPKDITHPYGYHKARYIPSFTACLIILAAACYLLIIGIRDVKWINMTQPGLSDIIALLVVIVSIFGNELLFSYVINASYEFDSVMLRLNAWDSRLNTVSSSVVLISILGTMVGFWQLDQFGTIIIAIIIIWTCMRIFQRALEVFLSKTLPSEVKDKIKLIVESVEGVKNISAIKTQLAGEKIFVDLVIVMDGTITTANANIIVNKIRERLFQNLKKVEQVRVGFECT